MSVIKNDDEANLFDREDLRDLIYLAQQFQELNLLKLHLYLQYGAHFKYNPKLNDKITLPLLVCLNQTTIVNDPFAWINEEGIKNG